MAMMPEMPGMAPNMSPVKMPRATAPMVSGVRMEMSPVQISAYMLPLPWSGLAEQDAGRKDDLA